MGKIFFRAPQLFVSAFCAFFYAFLCANLATAQSLPAGMTQLPDVTQPISGVTAYLQAESVNDMMAVGNNMWVVQKTCVVNCLQAHHFVTSYNIADPTNVTFPINDIDFKNGYYSSPTAPTAIAMVNNEVWIAFGSSTGFLSHNGSPINPSGFINRYDPTTGQKIGNTVILYAANNGTSNLPLQMGEIVNMKVIHNTQTGNSELWVLNGIPPTSGPALPVVTRFDLSHLSFTTDSTFPGFDLYGGQVGTSISSPFAGLNAITIVGSEVWILHSAGAVRYNSSGIYLGNISMVSVTGTCSAGSPGCYPAPSVGGMAVFNNSVWVSASDDTYKLPGALFQFNTDTTLGSSGVITSLGLDHPYTIANAGPNEMWVINEGNDSGLTPQAVHISRFCINNCASSLPTDTPTPFPTPSPTLTGTISPTLTPTPTSIPTQTPSPTGNACNIPCTDPSVCDNNSAGCSTCTNGGNCAPPACNNSCTSDASCAQAGDGCTTCDPTSHKCVLPSACSQSCTTASSCPSLPADASGCRTCGAAGTATAGKCSPAACNNACRTDQDCGGATDGCSICDPTSHTCQHPIQCSSSCQTDQDCSGALGGCTKCVTNTTTNTKSCQTPPACGSTCSTDPDCASAANGCNTCQSGQCVKPNSLAFTVFLHNIGKSGDTVNPNQFNLSNQQPVHPSRNFFLQIYDSNNNLIANPSCTNCLNYDSINGNFTTAVSVSNITDGDYAIKAKTDMYLRRLFAGILHISSGAAVIVPTKDMVAGDVVDDNTLDVKDYNTLLDCGYGAINPLPMSDPGSVYQSAACQAHQFKANADLNDDGMIDAPDYNLFIRELSVQKGD